MENKEKEKLYNLLFHHFYSTDEEFIDAAPIIIVIGLIGVVVLCIIKYVIL